MSYMWKQFNIKTFAAETVVFRNGQYCPDLSTLPGTDISQNYDLPVHIIYVGEIAGENALNINITVPNQPVFLSAQLENKSPAFLNIFIKNTGKNSELRGIVTLQNYDDLSVDIRARHAAADTGILIKTKLVAHPKSHSKLSGAAIIEKNCDRTNSDIGFAALADPTAKIEFAPAQYISAAPASADHSAAIHHGTAPQIQFLRESGLSGAEVKDALTEAFLNDNPLF